MNVSTGASRIRCDSHPGGVSQDDVTFVASTRHLTGRCAKRRIPCAGERSDAANSTRPAAQFNDIRDDQMAMARPSVSQTPQLRRRFSSSRRARASVRFRSSLSGISAPLPKYISSGGCPRTPRHQDSISEFENVVSVRARSRRSRPVSTISSTAQL